MMYPMLVADLMKALKDEQEAIAYYSKLASMAPSNWEKTIILGIRRDENAHALTLAMWLTRLTGHMHMVMDMPEPTIANFKDGVKAAIEDEQKAYDFYGDLANRAMYVHMELYYAIKNIQKDEYYHKELLSMMK